MESAARTVTRRDRKSCRSIAVKRRRKSAQAKMKTHLPVAIDTAPPVLASADNASYYRADHLLKEAQLVLEATCRACEAGNL